MPCWAETYEVLQILADRSHSRMVRYIFCDSSDVYNRQFFKLFFLAEYMYITYITFPLCG